MPAKKTNRVRVARPTTLRGPRFGVAGSLLLHGGILAIALFVWNRSLDLTSEKSAIVPVDLVTIAQKTDIAPMQVTPPVKIPPPQEMPPPPVNLATAPVAPEIKPPDIEVAPDAKPVKPTKQQVQQDLSDLLNDLTKPQKGRHGPQNVQGSGSQMAADLESALKSQVHRCWTGAPSGVPNAENMFVTATFSLARDGSLISDLLQSSADFGGTYQDAAREAVERAIEQCGPYKLPANRYSEWRKVTLKFDPSNPTGQ